MLATAQQDELFHLTYISDAIGRPEGFLSAYKLPANTHADAAYQLPAPRPFIAP
jgi:hypothetical protein